MGNDKESGQAVLIVLLGMAVALTVALSILSASTSDIRISSNEAESLRALSAAESGIEKSLAAGAGSAGNINNASFTANVTGFGQGQTSLNFPSGFVSGDSAVLWFVSHLANGSLGCDATHPCFTGKTVKVCWGTPGTASNSPTTPAIETSVLYLATPGSYGTVRATKAIYDPNSGRLAANSYSASDAGTCTIGQVHYAFQKQIDLSTLGIALASYGTANGLQFMPIKVLYNTDVPQPIGIDVTFPGDSTLPSEGSQIDSTGTLNQATRKVEVTRNYNQVPPVFDAAIFAPGGLVQ